MLAFIKIETPVKNNNQKEIIYQEIQPNSNLSTFVKSFWSFENTENKAQNYSILPDGCFDLLIYFKENKEKEIYLTGLWDKNIAVSIPAKTKILAIRFKPISAEYIIKTKIADLLNSMISVSSEKLIFLENLNTDYQSLKIFATSNAIKIQSILGAGNVIDTRRERVFDLLFKNNGVISIKEISEKSFWSNRQIRRYFKENYGLTIKKYANILRINSTFKGLTNGEHYPQTEYFDQSHFIKELKKYTGENPKTLIKNKNDRFLQLSTK